MIFLGNKIINIILPVLLIGQIACDQLKDSEDKLRSDAKTSALETTEGPDDQPASEEMIDTPSFFKILNVQTNRIDETQLNFSLNYEGQLPEDIVWQVLSHGLQDSCKLLGKGQKAGENITLYEIPMSHIDFDICLFQGKEQTVINEIPIKSTVDVAINLNTQVRGRGNSMGLAEILKTASDPSGDLDVIFEAKGSALIRRSIDIANPDGPYFDPEGQIVKQLNNQIYGIASHKNNLFVAMSKELLVFENANANNFDIEPIKIPLVYSVNGVHVFNDFMILKSTGYGVLKFNLANYKSDTPLLTPFYLGKKILATEVYKMRVHQNILWVLGRNSLAAYTININGGNFELNSSGITSITEDIDGNAINMSQFDFSDSTNSIQYIYYNREIWSVLVTNGEVIANRVDNFPLTLRNYKLNSMYQVNDKFLINTNIEKIYAASIANNTDTNGNVYPDDDYLTHTNIFEIKDLNGNLQLNFDNPTVIMRPLDLSPRKCLRKTEITGIVVCGLDGPGIFRVNPIIFDASHANALLDPGTTALPELSTEGVYGWDLDLNEEEGLELIDISENGDWIAGFDPMTHTLSFWDSNLVHQYQCSRNESILATRIGIGNTGKAYTYSKILTNGQIRTYIRTNGTCVEKSYNQPENTSLNLTEDVLFYEDYLITGTLDKKIFVFGPDASGENYETKANFDIEVAVSKIEETKDYIYVIGNGAIYILDKSNLTAQPREVIVQGEVGSVLLVDHYLIFVDSAGAFTVMNVDLDEIILIDDRFSNIKSIAFDGNLIGFVDPGSRRFIFGKYNADHNKFYISHRKQIPNLLDEGNDIQNIKSSKMGEFILHQSKSILTKFTYD